MIFLFGVMRASKLLCLLEFSLKGKMVEEITSSLGYVSITKDGKIIFEGIVENN